MTEPRRVDQRSAAHRVAGRNWWTSLSLVRPTDYENVPLSEDIDAYMAREVLPHVPDAWVDHSKTKVGYEIPFTRHFYVYQPPRPLEVVRAEIEDLEREIQGMLGRALS